MKVNPNISIVKIVEEFRDQFKKDPSKANRTMLEQGKALLHKELEYSSWNPEIVHRGHELLFRLGDKQGIVDLLKDYLKRPLSIPEKSWARWNLTDNFAMLRQHENTVRSQKDYLAWTRQILPQPNWQLAPKWPLDIDPSSNTIREDTPADEGLLFRVMYDGTQARSWIELEKSDEWLQIYYELMDEIPYTPRNRVERRYYLRTATMVMNLSNRPIDALQEVKKLDILSQEDPDWPEAFETQVDARWVEIEAYRTLDNMPQLRSVAESVTASLEEQYQRRALLKQEEVETLRRVYHNVAAPIYFAKQYDLAIPLFKRAIELEHPAEHPYLWLAASIWATKRERTEVLALLRQGASRSRFEKLQDAGEFKNVKDDLEFQAAMNRS